MRDRHIDREKRGGGETDSQGADGRMRERNIVMGEGGKNQITEESDGL